MRHCIPHRFFSLACLLALLLAGPVQAASLEQIVSGLDDRSYDRKEQVIGEIAASGDERSIDLLKRLLAGDLYFREADGRLVIRGARGEQGYAVTDALTGDALEPAGRRDLDKVSVNNRLRSVIRAALAGLNLNDPQVAVRYEAVQEMMRSLDEESVALLRQYRAQEQSRKVQEAMDQALAMANLADTDIEVQLAAVQTLTGSLNPEVRARLTQLRDTKADDPQARRIAAAAQEALAAIESRLQFYRLIETVFFGLSLGSVLLLAAIGLAITFGVMGVINMAHGELLMIGAYTTYVVQLLMPEAIGLSILVAVPAAFLVAGLFGVAIERGVIRFLYGRPLETLLATFGISLILQQLVRSIFSPLNRSVATPDWMSGTLAINPALGLTYNRLYIFIFSLLTFAALLAVMKYTRLGLHVRAVAQNRAMARALGIRSHWVDALTFGLGSGIAGVGGVALSQLTNVGPNLGQAYIVDSFLVVVFGGVGNVWGTLVAAMTLGVANKFLEPISGAVLAKIFVLVFIVLFIQRRPRGLFPQKGRAAEGS